MRTLEPVEVSSQLWICSYRQAPSYCGYALTRIFYDGYTPMDMLLHTVDYQDMPLPAMTMDMPLPGLLMVDMLLPAMDMNMLLLATDMNMPLSGPLMMDMLLPATDMDMPLPGLPITDPLVSNM